MFGICVFQDEHTWYLTFKAHDNHGDVSIGSR